MRSSAEDGYSGGWAREKPTRTEFVTRASQTHDVSGQKGHRIRELSSVVQKRLGFPGNCV